ncbi:MAG: tol-pal system protein YbgF [Acidobacteria bacterium]|nr:tol-pal system protein YbgF [Acidobacteriota bacterium]
MRAAGIVVLFLFLGAGVGHASKEMDQLMVDVKDLQKQVATLQQSIKDVTLQMVNVQARLQEQMTALQKNTADLSIKVDELGQRMQVLTEKMQMASTQLDSISEKLTRPQYEAPPSGMTPSGFDAQPPIGGPATPASPTGSPTPPPSGVLPPPDQIYNTAYTDYIKGNFDLAIAGFRQYITNYPSTQLSDNAQYWVGECYYSQKRYDQAVDEFNKAVLNYPKGDKIPSAMLKKGYALLELYRTGDAVAALQELIDKYGVSDEARIAKQRLQDLGLKPR